VGDLDFMRTDTRGLLEAGLALSVATWQDAKAEFDWSDMDRYIAHQISQVHTRALCEALDIDAKKLPLSFPLHGNMGPAAVPFTLAKEAESLHPGDRVLLLGIGSGLNTSCAEIVW
jgi:3-oxoacyl-[acyl-carrier-protein] synthase-3